MTDRPTLLVDLDGTLLDSRARLHALFCELSGVEDYGRDAYWQAKRVPVSNEALLADGFGRSAQEVATFVRDWLAAIEGERLLAMDSLHDGVPDALEALRGQYRLVLLTARQSREGVERQLARHGIDAAFADVLVTGGGRTKTATLEAAGYRPGVHDAAIGDTGEDVKVARSFGIESIVVTNGFRDADYLRRCEPDAVFDSITDFARAKALRT